MSTRGDNRLFKDMGHIYGGETDHSEWDGYNWFHVRCQFAVRSKKHG